MDINYSINEFTEQLNSKFNGLFWGLAGVEYMGLSIEMPDTSWRKALSEWESYAASFFLTLKHNGAEKKILLSYLPLVTPRNTFIIRGSERIRLLTLQTELKSENTRDLKNYIVEESNVIKRMEKYFNNIFKRIEKNRNNFFEAPDFFTGGAEALIKYVFNSRIGIVKFPFFDSTNPLSEVSHIRKVSFWGSKFSKKGKDIHPSHYGRLCIIETTESEKIGLKLHLAHKAEIKNGKILTPLKNLETGEVFQVASEDIINNFIADSETGLKDKVLVRDNVDGKCIKASKIKYIDAFNDQLFGYAALQIPFIQHNDPARALMGAKNLKQAVPLKNPEIPIIMTGYEKEAAEYSGRIIKAESDGEIVEVTKDRIVIKDSQNSERIYDLIYNVQSVTSGTAVYQIPVVKEKDNVKKGQIIAEGGGIKDGCLALGANFLVAYMPYFGYNMDDGIVVSRRVAEKLTSVHIEKFEFRIEDSDVIKWTAPEGLRLLKGTPLVILKRKKGEIKYVAKWNMIDGVVRKIIRNKPDVISVFVKHERPLEVGDKIMGRHGNKGIVARIFPSKEMPYFEIDKNGKKERRYIDIILNPHSVISRMNIGQLYETQLGWVAKEHPEQKIRDITTQNGKPFNKIDLNRLSTWLKESCLNGKGGINLHFKENGEDMITENPVVVGYQYIVKLNHLAMNKLSVRDDKGPVSSITEMPLSGKKRGGGQRIGEMEVWALLAHGADHILKEFLSVKSNARILDTGAISITESLKVFIHYLRGLGLYFGFLDKEKKVIEPEDFEKTTMSQIKSYRISWADDSKMMAWGRYLYTPKKNKLEKLKEYLERKEQEIEIRNGAKEILNLNDFESEYKDEMGYISLREPVKLWGRDVGVIPVIPIRCRPNTNDKINKLYRRIYLQKELINKTDKNDDNYESFVKKLQNTVGGLEKMLTRCLTGKKGIIRKAILGKRINFSGRGVIIPSPDIRTDEAEIPEIIMDELTLTEGNKVLLNRQPSLHIHNIQAFKVKKIKCNAIGINPLVCSGFNADFDGDSMAVYKTDTAAPNTMTVSEQIILAANGKLNLNISQDIAAGIYIASKSKDRRKEIEKIINDTEVYNADTENIIDKSSLDNIIYRYFLKKNDRVATLRLAEEIARFGFKWATFSGLTLSLFDLQEIVVEEAEKKNLNYDDKSIESSINERLEKNQENPISIMVLSGARGSLTQIRQMVGRKGVIERMGGIKTGEGVTSCYLKGLSPTEYYLASYGPRKSLGEDKKLMTPDCGYLTRRLIFTASDIVICEDDCGNEDGLIMKVENVLGRTALSQSLNGDIIIHKNTIIDEKLLEELKIKGIKEISVRSPLTCKSTQGTCKKCYGWELNRRSEPPINFKAGIIAAEVIGERATQDAMRTYHKGAATGTVKIFDKVRAIFNDSKDPETEKRVSEDINNIEDLSDLALRLYEYYEKKVDLKHYEVLIRALYINAEYKGTKKAIEERTILHSASFERTLDIFKNSANGEIHAINSIFERLFY